MPQPFTTEVQKLSRPQQAVVQSVANQLVEVALADSDVMQSNDPKQACVKVVCLISPLRILVPNHKRSNLGGLSSKHGGTIQVKFPMPGQPKLLTDK